MRRSGKPFIIYGIIIIAGLMVALGLVATNSYLTAKFQNRLIAELDYVLGSTHESLLEWTDVQLRGLQQWSLNEEFRQNVELLLEISPNQSELAAHPVQQFLRDQLRSWLTDYGNQGYFVISLEGINLASARDGNLGDVNIIKRMLPEFFEEIVNGRSKVSHPVLSDMILERADGVLSDNVATMFAMMPIRNEAGIIIAIFASRLDPSGSYSSLFKSERLGFSGETYALNKEGRMLSESRYNQQLLNMGLLEEGQSSNINVEVRDPGADITDGNDPSIARREQPLTIMAQSVTNGFSDKNIEGYNDYRGVEVIGSWLWDNEYNIGIATEIDKNEAFTNFRESLLIIYVFGSICGAILLITLFANVWVNRRFEEKEKALTESEEAFRSILENSPIAVAISLDDRSKEDGLVLFANQKLFDLSGYSHKDIGKLKTSDFVDKDLMARAQKFMLEKGGGFWNREQLIYHKDDSELYTLMSLSQLEYEGKKAALIWFYDVNYLKETEEALLIARNEAQAAGEAKSRFMANMSHEIRTPMNAVLGFTDLILRDKKLAKDHRKNLEIVNRSGGHLLSLINDILDMSKIEAEQLQLEIGDFAPDLLFKDLEVLFQIQMAEKGLEFSTNLDITVPSALNSDKRRIKQILINLTSNALKFTKQGSINIYGRTTVDKDKGLMFEIDICDTGSGIASEDQKRVFEAFEQTSEGIREGHGAGLGLPLSRRLARELGGDITITSELDKGTIFHITLQVEEASSVSPELSLKVGEIIGIKQGEEPPRVLLADDDEESLFFLKTMLEGAGFKIRSCSECEQLITYTERWLPHIILINAILPIMNGSDALAHIKESDKTKNIPIIIICASNLKDDVKEMLNTNADLFIVSPATRKEILMAIGKLIAVEFEYQAAIAAPELAQMINQDNNGVSSALDDLSSELIQQLQEAASALNATELESLLKEVKKYDQQLEGDLKMLINEYNWHEIDRILGL